MLSDASQYMNFVQSKVGSSKHGNFTPIYKVMKEYRSTNNVEDRFWFYPHDIKYCVSGNTKKYVLDWLIVPGTWLVKVGINMPKKEVLALEDTGFQLHHGNVLSSCQRLSLIATLPFRWSIAHPSSMFLQCNASQSSITKNISQKQMGQHRTHGQSLCGWNHCHSIPSIQNDNQHDFQGV